MLLVVSTQAKGNQATIDSADRRLLGERLLSASNDLAQPISWLPSRALFGKSLPLQRFQLFQSARPV